MVKGFFGGSPKLEYYPAAQEDCDIACVGRLVRPKGLGLVFLQVGLDYRNYIFQIVWGGKFCRVKIKQLVIEIPRIGDIRLGNLYLKMGIGGLGLWVGLFDNGRQCITS